jgi:hypothetical protein
VQREANAEWPRLSAPLQLKLECTGHGVRGEGERGDEAVALTLLDREDPAVARDEWRPSCRPAASPTGASNPRCRRARA